MEELYNYIQQKIDTLTQLLIHYQQVIQEQENLPEDQQNDQVALLALGKVQAYYSLIKSFKSERDQLELAINQKNDPKFKLKGS